jgi:hypothetical protein
MHHKIVNATNFYHSFWDISRIWADLRAEPDTSMINGLKDSLMKIDAEGWKVEPDQKLMRLVEQQSDIDG